MKPLQPSTDNWLEMPWDELLASLVMGEFAYTVWRSIKAFRAGYRGA